MSYYTYILRCSNDTLYSGWTTNVEQRLKQHNLGLASKYTRSRLPVSLVIFWEVPSKKEAMSFEWKIKQLTREQKLQLIHGQSSLLEPNYPSYKQLPN
jgi:putative endonuclease